MKIVYLCARWGRQAEMREHAETLVNTGHRVSSRWIHEPLGEDQSEAAEADLSDIDQANVVICFTESPEVGYTTGGRHYEMGYAGAIGTRTIVVGPREHVFCHLRNIEVVETLEAAIERL